MNNNFFALVRLLRDRGVDAELVMLENELEHFGPSCDTFDESFREYTHRVAWGDIRRFGATRGGDVAASVAPYDQIVACGAAPGFLAKARRRADVFAPYGTDVTDYPFLRLVRPRHLASNIAFRLAQRRGIRAAGTLLYDESNPDMARIVARLGYAGPRLNAAVPMIYTPLYDPATLPRHYGASPVHERFLEIRAEHDVVVFSSNRHIWTHPDRYNWDKGTERLLRGFAEFVRTCPDARGALVLFEYGVDVPDSKRLVEELGIGANVFWFPVMPRRDLMVGLSLADFGVGELAHSFVACGTIFESLALAKPLIGYRDETDLDASTLYPMVNVRTASEIASALREFMQRPASFRAVGSAGRAWLQRHGIDGPLDAILQALGRPAVARAESR